MRNHMAAGWFYSSEQIARYFGTRFTSLKPPKTKLRNPIHVLKDLDRHQWLMFSVGFLGWTWDAFDFFTVALCVTEIATEFETTNSAVSWGITITLMLRFVGALIFGSLSDRYGRKWTMITNLFLFIIFELASGFAQSLPQFLGVRALYGIAMGGLYGPAAATALEDLPYDARGLLSGLYQQGYAVGSILATIFYRALVPTTTHGWRSLFWFGAAPPVLIIAYRWWLPETNASQVMKAARESAMAQGSEVTTMMSAKAWLRDVKVSLKENWFLFIYLIVLMTGFNSCSHGSQDLYPTFLKNQVELGPTDVTIISVIGQIGAIIGGITIGYTSTFFGRRLSMITCCIIGAAVLPAYTIPRSTKLAASAFFLQFFVGGVWGPIPIYLTELSPPALRTTAVGVTYQLGNLASSAAATIQATIGERFPLPPKDGVHRYDYGKVIAVFMAAVWVYMLVFLLLGPEMSQEERDEYAAEAHHIERMRKEGVNLSEIGANKAKMTVLGDESSRPITSEKPIDVEHVE
ncbi:carboxylic acid transporter [Xylaria bambusicola]|uniref:carboxylic acid transporter n=1 Tax=Xylaria bambusicola TaxID=326684 RepID=UPI0020077D3E|nr:carboxylic acid transporter [Xylaria bambusicola]KAI0517292.1 carboxylic acid transporter [Xylaria bambusicola]